MVIHTLTRTRRAVGLGLLFVSALGVAVAGSMGGAKAPPAAAKALGAKPAAMAAGSFQAPTRFIENKGQWDSRAEFLGRGNGIDTWVTETSVYFDAYQKRIDRGRGRAYENVKNRPKIYRRGQVIRMDFIGGRPASSVEGMGELNGRTNYFTGPSNVSDARSYEESVMRNVYPGIDARLYFQDSKPRYDIIVGPGADPNQIQLGFAGANGVSLRSATELVLNTSIGNLSVSGLYAYQRVNGSNVRVPASFRLDDTGRVGFNIGAYDRSRPLIIDPVVYSTYLGGVGSVDVGNNVAVDRFNKAYVTGYADAPTFPTTIGAYDETMVAIDAFVSKFTSDGSDLEYSTYIGGGARSDRYFSPWDDFEDPLTTLLPDDIAYDIAVDFDGNAYVVGITACADFDVTMGAYNEPPDLPLDGGPGRTRDDFYDGFVVKLNPQGTGLVWSRYIGGERFDWPKAVALGQDGTVFVYGNTQSETGISTPGSFQDTMKGDGDAFLAKLSSDGTTVLYGTYLGGTDQILPDDPFLPDPPEFPFPPYSLPDDPDNPYDNSHTHGDDDVAIGMEVDSDGFAYILMRTTFNDAPVQPGSYDLFVNGLDCLVAKIAQDGGSLSYGTFLGGNDSDYAMGISLDATGNAYVTGVTFSFNYPRTAGAYDRVYNLGIDCFITKLNRLGNGLVYSTFLGTLNGVQPLAIKVDDLGFAHVTGLASQSIVQAGNRWLPVTPNGDQLDYAGPADPFLSVGDAFLMVMNDTGTGLQYCSYWGGSQPDLGISLGLDASRNAYLTGYTQSDAPSPIRFPTTPGAFKTGLVRDAIPIALPDAFLSKIKTRIPVTIQDLSIAPSSVPGGNSAVGTVTLSAPATTGGALVTISNSNNSVVSHPTAITIPAGATSGTFDISTNPNVVTVHVVQVTATIEGDSKTASLTVKPWLEGFTLSNQSVVGGNPMAARITLSFPAPVGGMVVQVSSTNTAVATTPATVTVLEGTTTTVFDVTTLGVNSLTTVEINASLNGLTKTQALDVLPASLIEVSFNPARVSGGTPSTGLVLLDGAAGPGGLTVDLSSDNAAAQVPATVFVAEQTTGSNFTATTSVVAVNQTAIITATYGANVRQTTLDVLVANLVSFTITPSSILGGNTATGIVQLSHPAATGGVTITLSSSDTSIATVPSTVVVPSGASNASFAITTFVRATTDTVTISADRDGAGVIPPLTADLEVRRVNFTVTIDPSSVFGGLDANGTVTLDEAAPPGGITVALSSDNGVVASVPATVSIPAGETEGAFVITTTPVPTDTVVTITGTFLATVESDTLTVLAQVPIDLDINPSTVVGGQSATGTVTLSGNAPAGGVVVSLSSSDPAATVPGTVTVPEGQNSESFTITTTGVLVDTTATITATVGTTSVTAQLTITSVHLIEIRFIPSRVKGGTFTTLRVTLDSAAPPAGATISLTSSNPSIATIPSSITVPGGATSQTVTIPTRRVSRTLATQVTASFGNEVLFTTLWVTR